MELDFNENTSTLPKISIRNARQLLNLVKDNAESRNSPLRNHDDVQASLLKEYSHIRRCNSVRSKFSSLLCALIYSLTLAAAVGPQSNMKLREIGIVTPKKMLQTPQVRQRLREQISSPGLRKTGSQKKFMFNEIARSCERGKSFFGDPYFLRNTIGETPVQPPIVEGRVSEKDAGSPVGTNLRELNQFENTLDFLHRVYLTPTAEDVRKGLKIMSRVRAVDRNEYRRHVKGSSYELERQAKRFQEVRKSFESPFREYLERQASLRYRFEAKDSGLQRKGTKMLTFEAPKVEEKQHVMPLKT